MLCTTGVVAILVLRCPTVVEVLVNEGDKGGVVDMKDVQKGFVFVCSAFSSCLHSRGKVGPSVAGFRQKLILLGFGTGNIASDATRAKVPAAFL